MPRWLVDSAPYAVIVPLVATLRIALGSDHGFLAIPIGAFLGSVLASLARGRFGQKAI